ncbi:hypothetical protein GIB67_001005 [Kingdonia uniflora]|uniref:protein acetyllysine N-acetyltransferase n=1 Tax=Kingdonia uniflora TaxID=39325 RepID=A0A7J7MG30_9MAGN|nr:hypothetical protein GIB67_001005 [Kingdonia uniflora]
MSLGYAEKLSYREDVGTVGMTELFDSQDVLEQKIEDLAAMIFKREGKGVPGASLPFHRAMPSLTHMALVELEKAGILKFVISQNVDSLHLRSGIPREKLSELHGNSFREICPSCGAEYLRDFEVETIGMKKTPRRCSDHMCGARLKDTVLDWENALPTKEMIPAEMHCTRSDLVLCLGTSLQITPACNLPLRSVRGGGKMVIVNLQKTPKDKKANLVIHAPVDKVIAGVMHLLNLRIPPYVRVDYFQVCIQKTAKSSDKYIKWTLKINSVHGLKAPLPFLTSIEVSFPGRPELKTAILDKEPFQLKRETVKTRPIEMLLNLKFSDGCGCLGARIEFPVDLEVVPEPFRHEQEAVVQTLKNIAIQELSCGQYSAVEKKIILSPKSEVTVYAIATNIVGHKSLFDNTKADGLIPESNGHSAETLNAATTYGVGTFPKRQKVY